MKEILVLGGPGCGKTTALLKLVDKCFEEGIKPERIAYLAFTRKAANEARDRAVAKFNAKSSQFPLFRTLHSFAFMMMGMSRNEIMQDSDYQQVGNMLNLRFSRMRKEFGLHLGSEKGDKVAYVEQLERLTGKPRRELLADERELTVWDVDLYAETVKQYKKSRGLYDFTDVLELYLSNGTPPNIDVLIIDEAQDLSPLQWKIVEKIKVNAKRIYYAGDDDQAIYKWAGADVEYFLNLKAEVHVLPVSHRLPSTVYATCNKILSYIKHRYPKNWTPAREGGGVFRYSQIEYVDTSRGDWLILARNRYMLENALKHLRTKGLPFIYEGKSSVDNDRVRAILAWEALRAGDSITGVIIKNLYRILHKKLVKHGYKSSNLLIDDAEYTLDALMEEFGLLEAPNWMDALQIPSGEREYYRAVKNNGESLVRPPRITVSTIHGVKGGEADNVILLPDMSYSSYNQFTRNPDDEARVFYVGASRAREALHILHPQTTRYFPI